MGLQKEKQMTHPSSAQQDAMQRDIPAQTAKPAPSAIAASVSHVPAPPVREDYDDYRNSTIMLVVQLRPQKEDGSRPVLLSVQNGTANKEDLPLYRLLSSEAELGGPLPPAMTSLLEALQQDLPARKQRRDQRVSQTARKAAITSSKTGTHRPQAQLATQTKDQLSERTPAVASTATPPIPNTPLPKEGLVLGGIFDDLYYD